MYTCSRLGLLDRSRQLNEEQKSAGETVSSLPTVTNQTPTSQSNVATNNFLEKQQSSTSAISLLHIKTNTTVNNNTKQINSNISVSSDPELQSTMAGGSGDKDVCYHHFALLCTDEQLKEKLSDALFVLIAGATSRVEAHSKYLEQLDLFKDNNWKLERLTNISGSRFDLFKVGPVLLANHGIGSASMSVAMLEILLMCRAANRLDKITLIRFGTCGGIGVEAGTICITNKVFDALFRSFVDWPICGKVVRRESIIDSVTCNKLLELGRLLEKEERGCDPNSSFQVVSGATMSTDDFYEEQGRTNGPMCDHSLDDKMTFLNEAQRMGVVNMEMEANVLAAICYKLNVKHAIVCVALTNRLIQDKISVSHDVIHGDFEVRLFKLNAKFIQHTLATQNAI